MQISPQILRHDRIWGARSGGEALRQAEETTEVKEIQALLAESELSGLPAAQDMYIRPRFRAPLPGGCRSYPSCTLSLGQETGGGPSLSQLCSQTTAPQALMETQVH